MSYHLTVKDIEDQTGLNYHYILKCVKEMPETFEKHAERGGNNSLLFNNNVISIFDTIKQLRDDNRSMSSIKKIFLKSGINRIKPSETTIKTGENPTSTDSNQTISIHEWKKDLQEAHFKYDQLKDELLEAKLNFEHLKSNMRLLTGGKDVEEVKKEEQEQKLKRVELLTQLESIEGHFFKKKVRIRLLSELKALG